MQLLQYIHTAAPNQDLGGDTAPARKRSQAERIIARFGGARRLARVLHTLVIEFGLDEKHALDPATIYRWTYPRSRNGTGGVIPNRQLILLKQAARWEGIVIPDSDWVPEDR